MNLIKLLCPYPPVKVKFTRVNGCGKKHFLIGIVSVVLKELDNVFLRSPNYDQELIKKFLSFTSYEII